MRNFLKFSLALVMAGGLFFTCSDEFLEQEPQAAFSEATLQNKAGVEAALIATYSRMDGWADDWANASPWGTSGSNWLFANITSDDAHKGSEPSDGADMGLIELFQWQPANGQFRAKFNVVYDGIFRANQTLLLMENAEDISDEDRARIRGEAVFLRSHYHFDAWRIWKNIPYFREADEDFLRTNDQDIFPEILADMTEAMNLLPESQNEIGRATKWAAKAYLGKMHLYNRDYDAARPFLNDVVNNGPFSLSDCYRDMFTVAGESGPEHIFSIQASVNDGSGGSDNGNFGDRLNRPHAGSPIGCCGFNQPTQNFVNAHRTNADGLPNFDDWNDLDGNPGPEVTMDPRLDWNVGRNGVPYLSWKNDDSGAQIAHDSSWIRDISWSSQYSPKKLIYSGADQASSVGWSNRQLNPVNIPVIRFAGVLLMLAEVEVADSDGDLERARELVNRVRARAANCAQGPDGGSVAIDDDGITWSTYVISTYDDEWTDRGLATMAVDRERRLEMAFEGHRYFDLVRRQTMVETMNEYLSVEENRRPFLQAAATPAEKNFVFPIPTEAIDLSQVDGTPTLRQNPGY